MSKKYLFKKHNTRSFLHLPVTKEGAGAVDEEDFIKGFEDVPTVQVYSDMCVKNIYLGIKTDVSSGHIPECYDCEF